MKKSFPKIKGLALILMGVLLLQGCQFFQPKDNLPGVDNQPMERRIGEIKSLGGAAAPNQGTHLLKMDSGDNILLKSLQIDLNDPKYKDHSVEVKGILTTTTDGKQIMEVMNIDVLEAIPTQQTQITSWKDYNSDLGFSMQYRDDFMEVTGDNQVTFKKEIQPDANLDTGLSSQQTQSQGLANQPIIHQIVITRSSLKKGQTLLSYLGLKSDSGADLSAKNLSKSKIGANSYDAFKETDAQKRVIYALQNGDSVFEITIDSGSDKDSLADQNIFYLMLSYLKIGADVNAVSTQQTEMTQASQVKIETKTVPVDETETVPAAETETVPAAETETVPVAETKTVPVAADTSGVTVPTSENGTQQVVEGYSQFKSDSFKFSVQYPKSWQYEGLADPNAIRLYQFSNKDSSKMVKLAISSGSLPSGATFMLGDKTAVKVQNGDSVEVYVKGAGKRVYSFSTVPAQESTMMQMAATIQE